LPNRERSRLRQYRQSYRHGWGGIDSLRSVREDGRMDKSWVFAILVVITAFNCLAEAFGLFVAAREFLMLLLRSAVRTARKIGRAVCRRLPPRRPAENVRLLPIWISFGSRAGEEAASRAGTFIPLQSLRMRSERRGHDLPPLHSMYCTVRGNCGAVRHKLEFQRIWAYVPQRGCDLRREILW
jgi:hypothetical protein